MEKKSKSIILGVVIVLLIVIMGVAIFFVSRQIANNTTSKGPQDSIETIPSDTISTPTDDEEANTLNFILTQ